MFKTLYIIPCIVVSLFEFFSGKGVFATKEFFPGDFLLEYAGELISAEEGENREETLPSVFRFFFKCKDKGYCIDATTPKVNQVGRFVNHGEKQEINSSMKVLLNDGLPVLCLFAIKHIKADMEILYDYGIFL
ncbi:N-lysine methyltransferase KMT5A-like [Anneissia japonica]|uniref:N-lysine methyltransferase KMT5A-like n=1 Tax=Anneissia japonica TaxID=1529436 RepID=UPI00142552CF|nr:N-lysine methyltransferase KMT5A-like [Anneissia japonica]